MEEKIELDEIGHLAHQFISNTSRHVFLTGKAGTGKTTLLKHVLSKTHKKTASNKITFGGVKIALVPTKQPEDCCAKDKGDEPDSEQLHQN